MGESVVIIHFPLPLLKAPLPHWVKLVWASIRSYQGFNKSAWPNLSQIGERIVNHKGEAMDKGQVSKAVKMLVAYGFLEVNGYKNYRCLMPEKHIEQEQKKERKRGKKVDERSTKRLTSDQPFAEVEEKKVDERSTKVDERSTKRLTSDQQKVDERSTPYKKEHKKEHKKRTVKKNNSAREENSLPVVADTDQARKPEELSAEEIVDLWNAFASIYDLALVRSISKKRADKIRTHKKAIAKHLPEIFQAIAESDFLLGKKSRWRVGFDFIWQNDTNYLKIIEGNYASTKAQRRPELSREDFLAEILA